MTWKGGVPSDSNRREATGSLAAQAIIATDWFTLSVDRHRVPALVAEEFASRVRPDERPGALERSPKRRIAEACGHPLPRPQRLLGPPARLRAPPPALAHF